MATREIPILNHTVSPDTSGDVFPAPLSTLLTLANSRAQIHYQMNFPTGSDVGLELEFVIPQEFVDTPVLVIKGILDGTPAAILAFGAQQVSRADSEAGDVAYEAEDLANNSTWTGYADEDYYEETITLTPAAAYVVGDSVPLSFYRDDSVDTSTFNFILTYLGFRFSDA
jgi:hypothetical protein